MHTRWQRIIGVTLALLMITAAVSAGASAAAIAEAGIDRPTPTGIQHTGPRSTAAAQATTISGCTEISTAGTYELTQDVVNSTADPCISINASNVVLNGNGHTLDGADATRAVGIIVTNSQGVNSNITIRNVTVTDWENGIHSQSSVENRTNIRVANVVARSNTGAGINLIFNVVKNLTLHDTVVESNQNDGISISADLAEHINITENSAANNSGHGISIIGSDKFSLESGGTDITVRNNTVSNNSGDGIQVNGDSTRVVRNIASDNGETGIEVSSNSRISNNTVRANIATGNVNGIETDGHADTIVGNIARNNTRDGISVGSFGDSDVLVDPPETNSTIRNNTALANGNEGIQIGGDTGHDTPQSYELRNNTVTSNDDGILMIGSSHRIWNNTVTGNNDEGIEIRGPENTVLANTIGGNRNGIILNGDNTTVSQNIIAQNTETGLRMDADSRYNRIINNTITSNGQDGIRLFGFDLSPPHPALHATLRNNTVKSNARDGIALVDGIANITLVDNVVSANARDGIRLDHVRDTTITNNTAMDNVRDGIRLDHVRDTTITNNTAMDNGRWAFSIDDAPDTAVTNLDIAPRTTVSFRGRHIGLKAGAPRPGDPADLRNLDKYVNVSSTSRQASWLDLNVSYTDSEVAALNESDLRLLRWNGSAWTRVPGRNTVDTTQNVVSANVTNITDSTLVTIFDKLPTRTRQQLFIQSVSPSIVSSPDNFTLTVTGFRLAAASFELRTTSETDVTPTNVRSSGNEIKAEFDPTDPTAGIWVLNATTSDGQQARVPLLVPPEGPLIESQSTWPFTLVPGRRTEMQIEVNNRGRSDGVAIVAVNFSDAMEVTNAIPGQGGDVISNRNGTVLIAQPVAANGDSAHVHIRFRLDPDRVVFPGQTPNATRTVELGEPVEMGQVTHIGTLTPAQWQQVKNGSTSRIRRRAENRTVERFERIKNEINRSLNHNFNFLFPVNSSTATADLVENFTFIDNRIFSELNLRASTNASAQSVPSPSNRVSPAQTQQNQDSNGGEKEFEIHVRVQKVDATSGESDWVGGQSKIFAQVAHRENREDGSVTQKDGIKLVHPDTPAEWQTPGSISWTQCGDIKSEPIPTMALMAVEEDKSEILSNFWTRVASFGNAVVGSVLAWGSHPEAGGWFSGSTTIAGAEVSTVASTAGLTLALIGLVMGGLSFADFLNKNDFFGVGGKYLTRTGSHTIDTGDRDVSQVMSKYGGTVPNKVEKFRGVDREGILKVKFQVAQRETGDPRNFCGEEEQADTRGSWDPNDISVQPTGIGNASHITADEQLRYRVRFENLENATAAAKDVTVTVPVDPALDFDSIKTRATSHPAVVNVTKDPDARTVTWEFSNINLPPNDNPPEGEGFVEFTAQPRANLSSGTTITENASIQFEFNPPIATNNVTHTVDSTPPDTRVQNLSSLQPTTLQVPWSGSDAPGGAGLDTVTLWAAKGNASFQPVAQVNASAGNITFDAAQNTTYRLTTTGQDRLGNIEPLNATTNVTVHTKGVHDYDRAGDGNTVIDTSELRDAITEWVNGKIDTSLLRDVISAWVNNTPV